MKKILVSVFILLSFLVACNYEPSSQEKAILMISVLSGCTPGDMRCDGNVAEMCNYNGTWIEQQNCTAIGETCSTSPANCGGYVGIACCY